LFAVFSVALAAPQIVGPVPALAVAAPVPIVGPAPGYGPGPAPAYAPAPVYADVPPAYDYSYGVADSLSGANFGASESRNGYATQGEYHVQLPDGRLQTVTYTADEKTGYIADVKYTGEPVYAAPAPAYAPAPAPLRVAPAPLPVPVAVAGPVPLPLAAAPAPLPLAAAPLPLPAPLPLGVARPALVRAPIAPLRPAILA